LQALRRGEILVAANPEFLRQGFAVRDFIAPSRTVVGIDDRRAEQCVRVLYRGIDAPFVVTDFVSAELIKYAANAYLAMRISFINEIARLCDALDADIADVALGIGLDPRIGVEAMKPGLGFGGSCLPKDLRGLLDVGKRADVPLPLASAVRAVNDEQVAYVVRRISVALAGLEGRRIGVLGATFKVGTDDLRISQALELVRCLASAGAHVCVYDPVAGDELPGQLGGIAACACSAEAAAAEADAVILATPWPQLIGALSRIKARMRGAVFCDARNAVDPGTIRSAGLLYLGVGRPLSSKAVQPSRLAV
jgi:UDPglucose 6-dehydrogenase